MTKTFEMLIDGQSMSSCGEGTCATAASSTGATRAAALETRAANEITVALGATIAGHSDHRIEARYEDPREMGRDDENSRGI